MYIVKITNNTPLCKMVNFSRSVLKIYTGQKKFTRAAPVAPVTNIRYGLAKQGGAYFSAVCRSIQDPIAAPGPHENQEF